MLREAVSTTARPIAESALTANISNQSMLRVGALLLERMLPRPESGLRRRNDTATGQSFNPDDPLRQTVVARLRVGAAWKEVENRYGYEFEAPEISARAVMGIALVAALESHHNNRFDRDRALTLMTEGTIDGFFPTIEPTRRRR